MLLLKDALQVNFDSVSCVTPCFVTRCYGFVERVATCKSPLSLPLPHKFALFHSDLGDKHAFVLLSSTSLLISLCFVVIGS